MSLDEKVRHNRNGDVVLVFDGGSKGNPGLGYGSYAIIINNEADITRLEFGDGVTNNEAEYDTLIAALEMFVEEGSAANVKLEIRGDSQLVIFQVMGKWKARDARMRARRDRVRILLRNFAGYKLVQQPRDDSVQVLGH